MNPKQELVAETAAALHSYGYQVYLSSNKEYGFYTNGRRVVGFSGPYRCLLDYYGLYNAKTLDDGRRVGTGWRIAKDKGVITEEEAAEYIAENPPQWAVGCIIVTMSTPERHLATYGQSSGYTLYQPEENHAAN